VARKQLDIDVFNIAIDRMVKIYEDGHTIVVSFSAGKDSGVCLEVCLIAATITNNLPLKVVMRDEEIMFPGTFEYAERTYNRPDIEFHWLIASQPVINIFNREDPYFWVFDPLLKPEQWVRQPSPFAEFIEDMNIAAMSTRERFHVKDGKDLVQVVGLRTQASSLTIKQGLSKRRWVIARQKSYLICVKRN